MLSIGTPMQAHALPGIGFPLSAVPVIR